jgi:hypothetical protein
VPRIFSISAVMKSFIFPTLVLLPALFCAPAAHAGERALVDLTPSPHAVMYMPDLADVKWNGGLLGERFEVARTTMVPHMWDIFRDPEASHA